MNNVYESKAKIKKNKSKIGVAKKAMAWYDLKHALDWGRG